MNSSKLFLVAVLLIASIALLFPNVQAQTTKIVVVRNPVHVLAGGSEPFTVQAIISFQDARPNSSLVVGVLDIDSKPQKVVPGIVTTASPDQCTNQPALLALCAIKLHSLSGTENLEFKIGGILGGQPRRLGTWNLNLTATLLDSNSVLIAKSASSVPFGVDLSPLSLTVDVPTQVKSTVDGAEQRSGSVTVGVIAGSHNISVPLIAYVDSGKRLRFDRWSDGLTEPNRTVNVRSASRFEAVYAIQYRLTLTGEQGSGTGQGWYDAGSIARFSVPQVESVSGLLGSLGGKLAFQGWYENGKLLANSSSGSVIMTQAHTLTVLWKPDYSIPIAIIAIPIIVVALILALVIRKRAHPGKAHSEISAPSSTRAQTRRSRASTRIRTTESRRSKSAIRRHRHQ
jgi:hypothetical protein